MTQLPQLKTPYATHAKTNYFNTQRKLTDNPVSMGVIPARNEWPILEATFTQPLYLDEKPQNEGDVRTLPLSPQVPLNPCLQVLAVDPASTKTRKVLARHGFEAPYGFSEWYVDPESETMEMIDAAPPAIQGTPYAYHETLRKTRSAPLMPLSAENSFLQGIQVPLGATVKGGFELNKPLLAGPLHMSPSLKVHLHEGSTLHRPMFYGGEFTVTSDGATFHAPYIEDSMVSITGRVTMGPAEFYRDITNTRGYEVPTGELENFSFRQFIKGPYRPIRSRDDLDTMVENDPDPVLMSPSFGHGVPFSFVLSKSESREIYPVYTLRKLLEIPQRVLAQTLFWPRGSVTNSTINITEDVHLNDMLLQNCSVYVPAGVTLYITKCLVLNMKVIGGGHVRLCRTPCYRLESEVPVELLDMNHFTPLVECSSRGKSLELTLTGRRAGLLAQLKLSLKAMSSDPQVIILLPYTLVRAPLKRLLDSMENSPARYEFLLKLLRAAMVSPASDMKQNKSDRVPYFVKGMGMRDVTQMIMAAEKGEFEFNESLYKQMVANL